VTKSVVALAFLHAVTNGKIKNLDEPVGDIFPAHKALLDGDKKSITIRHLLTMSAGLEWDEDISYADPKNSERLLDQAKDPVAFVLGQKLVTKPGAAFRYNGGLTQILAEIVERKTGVGIEEYVVKNLFTPLGITKYEWAKLENGDPSAASGLRLRTRDMAKLGLLVWQEGKWQGKRLIGASLVRDAVKSHISLPIPPGNTRLAELGYGYQMWVRVFRSAAVPLTVTDFNGNGGQIVSMDREHDLMTVVTAGNYNQRVKNSSGAIYPDLIFPALIRK
jgi:CubicO group peptidase (beta-lactamase class C family)